MKDKIKIIVRLIDQPVPFMFPDCKYKYTDRYLIIIVDKAIKIMFNRDYIKEVSIKPMNNY